MPMFLSLLYKAITYCQFFKSMKVPFFLVLNLRARAKRVRLGLQIMYGKNCHTPLAAYKLPALSLADIKSS